MHPRTRARTVLIAAFVVLDAGLAAGAEPLSRQQQVSVLNDANVAFDRGMSLMRSDPMAATQALQNAAAGFRTLLDAGVRNGRLYYNLGSAELQLGHVGRAILNYRRAQQYIPGDSRLAANLRFARSQTRNQIPPSGRSQLLSTLFFFHYGTSLRTRFALGLACYVAFWLVLFARLFVRRQRLGYVAAALGFLWLTVGGSVVVDRWPGASRPAGVTLANDVVVRKGNGESYDLQFQQPLHEGVEFELIESRAGWYCIELPDGKTGWIRASQAELL